MACKGMLLIYYCKILYFNVFFNSVADIRKGHRGYFMDNDINHKPIYKIIKPLKRDEEKLRKVYKINLKTKGGLIFLQTSEKLVMRYLKFEKEP